jgi:two-component system nitrate/nitrite response regulator NarL
MRRTVLVVDDHSGFRASVRALLHEGPFEVVAEAEDAEAALAAVRTHKPDVVLLDIALPRVDGFAIAERLAGHPSPPAVVLVSTRDASDYGSRLAGARVRGFIQKAQLSIPALEAVLA